MSSVVKDLWLRIWAIPFEFRPDSRTRTCHHRQIAEMDHLMIVKVNILNSYRLTPLAGNRTSHLPGQPDSLQLKVYDPYGGDLQEITAGIASIQIQSTTRLAAFKD